MKKNIVKLAGKWLAVIVAVVMMGLPCMKAMAEETTTVYYENNTTGGSTTVAVDANARTTGSLEINGTTGATYSVYKVFSASVKDGESTYTWTEVDAFSTALNGTTAEDISKYNASDLKALATTLATAVSTSSGSFTAETDLSSLALGYYLVIESETSGLSSSQPILVAIPQVQEVNGENQWVYDIKVSPKSSSTDFSKKIAVGDNLVDTSTADIGDYVSYRLFADIPTYESTAYTDNSITLTFTITDNMSKELTWGTDSAVSVYVIDAYAEATVANLSGLEEVTNTANENYSVTAPTSGTAGGSFTVAFTKSFLQTYQGKVVIVAFSAQLNDDAVIANTTSSDNTIDDYDTVKDVNYNGKGNPNAATLTYTNNYEGGTDTGTIKDIVTTYTFQLDVEKVDADSTSTLLAGAEFKIYTDSACQTGYTNTKYSTNLLESVDSGVVSATGLDAGTYYLKETKAPEGYSLYDGVITVTIVAGTDTSGQYDGSYTYTVTMGSTTTTDLTKVTVADEKGTTLPGTGGIGTTIFTVSGVVLILVASAALYIRTTRKRRAA